MTANLTYQDRIPFVYIVGWSAEGVYYIGSRTARGCHPSDIGTTYFTSSKVVRKKWQGTPPDIIQVLMTFTTKEAAIEFEHTALLNLEAHKNPQLLNRCVGGKKFVGRAKSQQTKVKLSHARKGTPAWNKGKSSWNKGKSFSDETRAKISAACKGKRKPPLSNKQRESISLYQKSRTRKPHSDETRAKMRAAHARRKAAAGAATFDSLSKHSPTQGD